MKKLIIAIALLAISSPAAARLVYDQYGRLVDVPGGTSRPQSAVSRMFQQEMDRDLSGETNRRRVEEQRRQSQEDQRRFEEETRQYNPGDVYRYQSKSRNRW